MQISPISFNSNLKIRKYNVSREPKSKIFEPEYPRRYLPEYYMVHSLNNTYDSFTKLRDKNYLLSVIDNKILQCNKSNQGFAIAMFDMDNFKSVNELLGYKMGDDFILEISKIISDVANQHELNAYRFGGEEFVIVLDENNKNDSKDIINEIKNSVKSNDFVKSNAGTYVQNAYKKLNEYYVSNNKIRQLMPLKAEIDILRNLQSKLFSDEAKNDPYLKDRIYNVEYLIKKYYIDLISESAENEENRNIQAWLFDKKFKYENDIDLNKSDQKDLDEYLLSVYDKNFEIYQMKKWVKDFNKNKGFSITAATVEFNKDSINDKKAIDVINEAGEVLKLNKNKLKDSIV